MQRKVKQKITSIKAKSALKPVENVTFSVEKPGENPV
jgi:hypothetical protein